MTESYDPLKYESTLIFVFHYLIVSRNISSICELSFIKFINRVAGKREQKRKEGGDMIIEVGERGEEMPSLVAQMIKDLPAMQETHFLSLDRKDPLRRKWQCTVVFLPRKSHGQRSLAGYSL